MGNPVIVLGVPVWSGVTLGCAISLADHGLDDHCRDAMDMKPGILCNSRFPVQRHCALNEVNSAIVAESGRAADRLKD